MFFSMTLALVWKEDSKNPLETILLFSDSRRIEYEDNVVADVLIIFFTGFVLSLFVLIPAALLASRLLLVIFPLTHLSKL